MEPEGSFQGSEELTTDRYHEPNEFNPYLPTRFLSNQFYY
jgi:hypothetical protein